MSQRTVHWLHFNLCDANRIRYTAVICTLSKTSRDAVTKGESFLRRRGYSDVALHSYRLAPAESSFAPVPIEALLLRDALRRGLAAHVRPSLIIDLGRTD